jgi:hypothetical protein
VPKKKKPSPDTQNSWPEVFNEIEIKSVPIEYLSSVQIHFVDGKTWEINIDKARKDNSEMDTGDIENSLDDLIEEYEDAIDTIDFRLDTAKVKRDITKRTKVFMKKRK